MQGMQSNVTRLYQWCPYPGPQVLYYSLSLKILGKKQFKQRNLERAWRQKHAETEDEGTLCTYFPTNNVHLTYNAHPKLFYVRFEVQITRT